MKLQGVQQHFEWWRRRRLKKERGKEKIKKKDPTPHIHIPMEIVKEVLNHLPLISKLWFAIIKLVLPLAQKEEEEEETHIPAEIVEEILDRLPLKSLARFKCTSKLWSSLIHPIIVHRVLEEMDRKMRKSGEVRLSIKALCQVCKGSVDHRELVECIVRMRIKLGEMLSVFALEEDMERMLRGSPGYGIYASEILVYLAAQAHESLCDLVAVGANSAFEEEIGYMLYYVGAVRMRFF